MASEHYIGWRALEPEASAAEHALAKVLVHEDIPTRDGFTALYLRRFHAFSEKWFPQGVQRFLAWMSALYIHCFYRSDEDPDPHDHPFDFVSVVVRGHLIDEVWAVGADGVRYVKSRRVYGPGSVRFCWAEHLHRAILVDPTKRVWTVVLRGPRRRKWYFWTVNGPVFHVPYLASRRRTP